MSDITKCDNHNCKHKDKCYRYLVKINSKYQSYLYNFQKDCVEENYKEFIK